MVSALDLQRREFSPQPFPVYDSYTMPNRSPPSPLTYGCVAPSTAFAATAASRALPPASRSLAPVCEARNCDAATIPYFVTIIDRACSRGGPVGAVGATAAAGAPPGASSWAETPEQITSKTHRNFIAGS